MKKIGVFLIMGLLLVGITSAGLFYKTKEYSNPKNDDGLEIDWDYKIINEEPIKISISKEGWNKIFEDYRDGEISKEEAKKLIRKVEIKW